MVFAEDCSKILIGSNRGFVYVFDRHSGSIIDRLEMGQGDWVQAIIVSWFHVHISDSVTWPSLVETNFELI